jgi:hypothetical protein
LPRRSVIAFFVCFFGLLASGHLGSSDAGGQLRAATLLVQTGGLSAAAAPAAGWLSSPGGRFYEVHDIGAIVLMLPAGIVAARAQAALASAPEWRVPRSGAAVASLSYAILAALACWWTCRTLAEWYRPRQAFAPALALPFTTILTAYGRTAWDVLGCAAFVAGAMAAAACALTRGGRRQIWMTAALLGVACSFRFSFAPFAALTLALLFASGTQPRDRWGAAAVLLLVLAPSFAYNMIRTGAFWRPPTTLPAYLAANNAIEGDIAAGVFGVLLSPNRGLFVFCPVLLLALGLPAVWARIAASERRLVAAFGAGARLYVVMIASRRNWGAFGWGPRYLVPILPIAYVAAAIAFVRLWHGRAMVLTLLLACSAAVTLPSLLVNWPAVVASVPGAADQFAPAPVQIRAGWRALGSRDPFIVPDVWTAHLFRTSPAGTAAAATASIALLAGALISLRRILRETAAPE